MKVMRRLSAIALSVVLGGSAFPAEAASVIARASAPMLGAGTVAPSAVPIAALSAVPAVPLLGAPVLSPSLTAPSVLTPSADAAPAASAAAVAAPLAAPSTPAALTVELAAAAPAQGEFSDAAAAALFDATAAHAAAVGDPDDLAAESASESAASSASRRLLSVGGKPGVLARAGAALTRVPGIKSLWGLYRDGVLVQRYVERLSDQNLMPLRRAGSARRLAALGGVSAVPALGSSAEHDPDASVRRASRTSLNKLADITAPRLIRTLKTNPFSVSRETAAISLGWLLRHADASEAFDALGVAGLMDRSEGVRLASIRALAGARDPKAAGTLAWMRVVERRPYMRAAVERALDDVRARHAAAGTPHLVPPSEDLPLAANAQHGTALKSSIAVGLSFAALEFLGGLLTGTLALKVDALQLAGDRALDAAALFAVWLARRPPTSRKTYGWLKAEAVISFVGALVLAAMAVGMAPGVIAGFLHPAPVAGWGVLGFAAFGVASNLFSAAVLSRHQKGHQGVRGAFLHAVTDAFGTIGIMIAAAASLLWGWSFLVPAATAALVLLVLRVAWALGRPAWNVLIDSAPAGLDMDRLESDLAVLPGVASVYDLHVRALNSLGAELAAKLYVRPGADHAAILASANAFLRERYGIVHSTIQIEPMPPAR